jgi:hypothetical protein
MGNVPGRVRPGDWFCVDTRTLVGRLIIVGEWLNGDGFRDYEHAAVVTAVNPLMIVEARSSGAAEVPYHYEGCRTIWSTGLIEPPDRDAIVEAARDFIGTPYSFLDYFALALHRLHIPAPGLRSYIASTGHMICSQLVDQCELNGGMHLFTDGRWPGYVTPAALGDLLLRVRAQRDPQAPHGTGASTTG